MRGFGWCRLYLLLCLLVISSSTLVSADERALRPGRLSSEEREALQPGLRLVLTNSSGAKDARSARTAAFLVPAGEVASPFLSPGDYQATLQGYLKLRLRGDYQFALRGNGTASLSLNDVMVIDSVSGDLSKSETEPVAMVKGYNRLEIEYAPPSEGVAQVRLYWRSDEFPWEPVPPPILLHDGRDPHWQLGQQLRQGRKAFARHNCTKCHTAGVDQKVPGVMPELNRDAPALDGVTRRLRPKWIADWMLNPAGMRNKTTMPQVLSRNEAESAKQARDIVAYLRTLPAQSESPEITVELSEDAFEDGEKLFENRGCIACHRMTAPEEEDAEFNRVSLHYAAAKYQPAALAAYLKNPRAHYTWSRMPVIPLTDAECQSLASFVLQSAEGKASFAGDVFQGSPKRGAELFRSTGCANCHSPDRQRPVVSQPIDIKRHDHGCLATDPTRQGTAPKHKLRETSRTGLAEFLKVDRENLTRTVASEFSQRQWDVMNCRACHKRDGQDDLLTYALIEDGTQGKPVEPVPDVTWAGEKLRPQWTRQLFSGGLEYRPRPHFHIRMPQLPARGDLISKGLSYEHGFALTENLRPNHDEKLAEVGVRVAAMEKGLACHRCHAIGDKQATAPFEARSTNLSYATERLRYDYYHRWMQDPLRIDPQTKMIKFAQDGRRTGLDTIYEGDARQQFEAIWHWLEDLREEARKK